MRNLLKICEQFAKLHKTFCSLFLDTVNVYTPCPIKMGNNFLQYLSFLFTDFNTFFTVTIRIDQHVE